MNNVKEQQEKRRKEEEKDALNKRKMRIICKVWLKQQSVCLASVKPRVQTPVLPNQKKKSHSRGKILKIYHLSKTKYNKISGNFNLYPFKRM
jgi:hypothetical protein